MRLTPAGLLGHARSDAGKRQIKYGMVSVICVVITQVLLFGFTHGAGMAPGWGSFAASVLCIPPAFYLNKRIVWAKSGKAHMRREVLPFTIFTLGGLALSTLMVIAADHLTDGLSKPVHQLIIQLANIAGFGLLWVVRYIYLDKVMFGAHHHTPYDEDVEVWEAAHPETAQPEATA